MCRLFALRANQPSAVRDSLLAAPHSLYRQSLGDRRGSYHANGWGIGWYEGGLPIRKRAPHPAHRDPEYRRVAEAVCAATVLAHVRQASVGAVVDENTHPFAHGPWLFAHNGTLQGFAQDPGRFRALIPNDLVECIEGQTDSEHVFYYLLARLRQAAQTTNQEVEPDTVAEVVAASVRALAELFPGGPGASTQINVVLTDGRTLVATRWGHTLFWLTRHGANAVDGPAERSEAYRAIAVASEPITEEEGWTEVPDRSVLLVRPDMTQPSITSARKAWGDR
jgi:glutamine amidotransferase